MTRPRSTKGYVQSGVLIQFDHSHSMGSMVTITELDYNNERLHCHSLPSLVYSAGIEAEINNNFNDQMPKHLQILMKKNKIM